jgi:hypothetical protein
MQISALILLQINISIEIQRLLFHNKATGIISYTVEQTLHMAPSHTFADVLRTNREGHRPQEHPC